MEERKKVVIEFDNEIFYNPVEVKFTCKKCGNTWKASEKKKSEKYNFNEMFRCSNCSLE